MSSMITLAANGGNLMALLADEENQAYLHLRPEVFVQLIDRPDTALHVRSHVAESRYGRRRSAVIALWQHRTIRATLGIYLSNRDACARIVLRKPDTEPVVCDFDLD